MKIIGINSCDYGSTGNIAADLLIGAKKCGHNVLFCCPNPTRKDLPTYNISVSKVNRLFNRLITKILGNDGFTNWINTNKLIKKIKKIKPDVVHLHNLHGYYINLKSLIIFLKRNNIRTIWTLHDCWPFTGKCTYFLEKKCNKWMNKCCDCPNLNQYPKSWFFDRSKSLFLKKKNLYKDWDNCTIVTVSHWLEECVHSSIMKKMRTVCIYNYLTCNFLKAEIDNSVIEKYKIPNDKYIILSAAYPWPAYKGYETILEISKLLYDYKNIVFVVCGRNEYSFNGNIINLPKLDVGEMKAMYNLCDCFLNPSMQETFGLTNIEAQYFGKKIIFRKGSGGTQETVIEGKTGYGYKNVLELYKIILKLMNEKNDSSLSLNNATRFNFDKTFNKYMDIYKN